MSTLVYIFIFLALYHFIYESIVAKSLRHTLRYKFFALRDELRYHYIIGEFDDEKHIYRFLDASLCNVIYKMYSIDMNNYMAYSRSLKKDPNFKKKDEKIAKLINGIENEKLKEIELKMRELSVNAIIINNGAWVIYIIGLIIPILLITSLFQRTSQKLKQIGEKLIFNPKLENSDRTPGFA